MPRVHRSPATATILRRRRDPAPVRRRSSDDSDPEMSMFQKLLAPARRAVAAAETVAPSGSQPADAPLESREPRGARSASRRLLVSRKRFEAMLAEREPGGPEFCLLQVGIDGLGAINADEGYELGDEVLEGTVRRLCALQGAAAVCRVAGDEYAVCIELPLVEAEQAAQRLVERFRRGIALNSRRLGVGLSIGIVTSARDGRGTRLMRHAAIAMRTAKRAGGAAHALFDRDAESQHQADLSIARELRQAVARNELQLVYQPKVEAVALQVTAVEALLRWQHPTLGHVSPGVFIPIAERFGLIDTIGNWVMDQALTQAAQWREQGLNMRVAINVSPRQMRSEAFAARLEQRLAQHGLPPSRFTCEITESVATEGTEHARRAFARLRQIGVHISVDDFGTGYSNLSSLCRMPVRELKLDRSFVDEIAHRAEARDLVKAVVDMAHALGLRVIAEGIETPQQRDMALAAGCDELQGYLFAKPMSARAIEIWAGDHRFAAAPAFKPSLFQDQALDPAPGAGLDAGLQPTPSPR
jgi:diguanylate cyclase (GGDEF)-like protein